MAILLLLQGLLAWTTAQAISTAWRPSYPAPAGPILHREASSIFHSGQSQIPYDAAPSSLLAPHDRDRCTLYKIAMNQQLYFEVSEIDGRECVFPRDTLPFRPENSLLVSRSRELDTTAEQNDTNRGDESRRKRAAPRRGVVHRPRATEPTYSIVPSFLVLLARISRRKRGEDFFNAFAPIAKRIGQGGKKKKKEKKVAHLRFLSQYVHYKTELPDMKEFTLCMWTKFYNHSNDHPLFSYAGKIFPFASAFTFYPRTRASGA